MQFPPLDSARIPGERVRLSPPTWAKGGHFLEGARSFIQTLTGPRLSNRGNSVTAFCYSSLFVLSRNLLGCF